MSADFLNIFSKLAKLSDWIQTGFRFAVADYLTENDFCLSEKEFKLISDRQVQNLQLDIRKISSDDRNFCRSHVVTSDLSKEMTSVPRLFISHCDAA